MHPGLSDEFFCWQQCQISYNKDGQALRTKFLFLFIAYNSSSENVLSHPDSPNQLSLFFSPSLSKILTHHFFQLPYPINSYHKPTSDPLLPKPSDMSEFK